MVANKNEEKKFYWISIGCIIPAFGTILGLFLLIYTTIKFRSRKLFFVILSTTIAGGAIGVAMNSYEKWELRYGKDAGGLFARLAGDELDRIVVTLNQYKSVYGEFPDSLQELRRIDPLVPIKDPLLARNPSNKFILYRYQKVNQSYTLFSSGIDGMPNTPDDIYPRNRKHSANMIR